MMASDVSTVMRPRLLANSAVDFVENRARELLGSELVRHGGPQYVSDLDQFVPKEGIVKIDYFAESQKKKAALKTKLLDFSRKIQGIDKGLNIPLKAPEQYRMDDVLDIVDKIQDKHRNADKVNSCSGIFRRCLRAVGDNKGPIEVLLEFAPDDVYGSVISGGLTLILGAIERAETMREDMYAAVADIPFKMMEIQDLLEVHSASEELHRRADSVFVAVFDVLFAIVEELSKNIARKGFSLIIKGSKYGEQITEHIAALEKSVESFRIQVNVCHQQRFGRMDTRVARAVIAAENTEIMVAENHRLAADNQRSLGDIQKHLYAMNDRLAKIEAAGQLMLDKPEPRRQIEYSIHQTAVFNQVYFLCTGSSLFDPQTGNLNLDQYKRRKAEIETSSRVRLQKNRDYVQKWLAKLGMVHLLSSKDESECLEQYGVFPQSEKDKAGYLLYSAEMMHWLKDPEPGILVVQADSRAPSIFNAVSYISACLLNIMRSPRGLFPVLGFFSGLRTNVSMDQDTSGPAAMLAALVSQLLDQMPLDAEHEVDLSSLGDPSDVPRNSADRVEFLGRKLRHLIGLLPEGYTVFIVLDSVYHLTGEEEDQDAALGHVLDLSRVAHEESGVIVKIFATNFLGDKPLRDHRMDKGYTEMCLPDTVDGIKVELNEEALDRFNEFQQSMELV